jgi:hypothetical protein
MSPEMRGKADEETDKTQVEWFALAKRNHHAFPFVFPHIPTPSSPFWLLACDSWLLFLPREKFLNAPHLPMASPARNSKTICRAFIPFKQWGCYDGSLKRQRG